MRKHFKILSVFTFFIGFILFAEVSGVNSATFITNLSLEKKKDFAYFTIFSKGKIEFSHFVLPAKDDKPDRIVVDLKNAVHKLPKYNYINLPWDMITAIRTSQYQAKPEKITRIVLDLKEPVVYKIVQQSKENEMTFAISTKNDPLSFFWAAHEEKLKTVKDEPKSEKKLKELARVSEKPPIKETSRVTPSMEIKKQKDKVTTRKEIEKTPAEVKALTKMPADKGIESSKLLKPKSAPLTSSDTSKVQKLVLPESEEEGGIAERESLIYQSEGRRDPFVPLSQEIDLEFGEVPLPSVENLKLVGMLEDKNGYLALLEDDRGYGYLLKSGDRVKNGYVKNILENMIIFEIEEYGWSRVISLELPPEF